jgi:chemotaxis protein methyltransferase CheR
VIGAEDTGPTPDAGEVKPLDENEFALYQRLVFREAGIALTEVKRALVASRLLRRIRELGLKTYAAYYRVVIGDAQEQRRMLDAITTNETHFFREPRHWDLLSQDIAPRWRQEAARGDRKRRVRVWSAGCSTGEEPYSLAMALSTELPADDGWEIEIFATDLSTRVLDRARDGIFGAEKAAEIPRPLLQRYMLKGFASQDGNVCVSPALRSLVTFQRLNLNDDAYSVGAPFDAILCRNVFIYFARLTRERIVQQLLGHFQPNGFFFVGHAESLGGTPGLETVIPTVYRKVAASAAEPRPRARAREDAA